MANALVDLEVHETIERNRERGAALDLHAVLADVTGDDRRHARLAAAVLPGNLPGNLQKPPIPAALVGPSAPTLNQSQLLFHHRASPD